MDRLRKRNFRQAGTAALAAVLLFCTLCISSEGFGKNWRYGIQKQILTKAQEIYMPVFTWVNRTPGEEPLEWVRQRTLAWFPIISYVEKNAEISTSIEDEETIARILEAQAGSGYVH